MFDEQKINTQMAVEGQPLTIIPVATPGLYTLKVSRSEGVKTMKLIGK